MGGGGGVVHGVRGGEERGVGGVVDAAAGEGAGGAPAPLAVLFGVVLLDELVKVEGVGAEEGGETLVVGAVLEGAVAAVARARHGVVEEGGGAVAAGTFLV